MPHCFDGWFVSSDGAPRKKKGEIAIMQKNYAELCRIMHYSFSGRIPDVTSSYGRMDAAGVHDSDWPIHWHPVSPALRLPGWVSESESGCCTLEVSGCDFLRQLGRVTGDNDNRGRFQGKESSQCSECTPLARTPQAATILAVSPSVRIHLESV